ncbi:hypothetical protein QTP88_016931 [Uroleucon formosanum]
MSFRKHESGASKRKALNIRNEYEAKIPKLSNFFQPIENPAFEPKTKKTVGEIDTNTDKKILTELEINKDPALWPSMSETVREKCIQLGPANFQNKNNGFSASLRDYKNQKRNSKKSSKTLKSLSSTRWSCRNDAIEVLAGNYDEIYNTLSDISQDMNENADTRHDANSIKKKLIKLEIAFMTIFWKRVLGKFNATSVYLQRIEIDMVTGNSMLQSLITFVDELRNDFDAIEDKAKILSLSVNKE